MLAHGRFTWPLPGGGRLPYKKDGVLIGNFKRTVIKKGEIPPAMRKSIHGFSFLYYMS